MDRKEWLAWRKIGSSDAATILGLNPWRTAFQLWEERINGTETPDNAAMARGRELEPIARNWISSDISVNLEPKNLVHPIHHWMTASLDAFNEEAGMLVEIKAPGEKTHAIALEGKVPDLYMPQCQHQLAVTGLKEMLYFSFDGDKGVYVLVYRDEAFIEALIEAEREFWRCIIEMEAPKLTDRDYVGMEANGTWIEAENAWIYYKDKLKEVQKQEEKAREELLALTKDKSCMGSHVRATKITQKGAIDYTSVPELKDVNLEPFRKKSFTKWRLSDISERE